MKISFQYCIVNVITMHAMCISYYAERGVVLQSIILFQFFLHFNHFLLFPMYIQNFRYFLVSCLA